MKDTCDVQLRGDKLFVGDVNAAELKVFDDNSCVQRLLDEDDNPLIQRLYIDEGVITGEVVTNVDVVNNVYEILNVKGSYYCFCDGNHTYIVVMDDENFQLSMIEKLDKWCMVNAKGGV